MKAFTIQDIEHTSIVPQCDSMGYQSENLAMIDVLTCGLCYTFDNINIIESRAYHPFWTFMVAQFNDEGERIHGGMFEIDVRGMDEEEIDANLAAYLLNHDFECFAC